jgi:hypothetical protein
MRPEREGDATNGFARWGVWLVGWSSMGAGRANGFRVCACGMGCGRVYAEAVVYVQWQAAAQWCANNKRRARNRGLGYDEVCEGESGLDGWKGLIGYMEVLLLLLGMD